MNKKKIYGELLEVAERARAKSYSPYSGISVGAALLTESGTIYTGANIENAAYGPTVCAERVAIFSAVHAGERDFVAIAIAGGRSGEQSQDAFVPCGVCRQVMAEFAGADLVIITAKGNTYEARTLGELLPYAFSNGKL